MNEASKIEFALLVCLAGCMPLDTQRHAYPVLLRGELRAPAPGPVSGTEASGFDAGFSLWLWREDLDVWPDSAVDVLSMLRARFGDTAVIRVNGLETTYVPPKELIQSIHVSRAAGSHSIVIDINAMWTVIR